MSDIDPSDMYDTSDIETFLNSKSLHELFDYYSPEQLDYFYDHDIFSYLSVANQRKLRDLSRIFSEEEWIDPTSSLYSFVSELDGAEDGRGLMKKKSKKRSKTSKRRNKGKKKGKKSAKKGKKSAKKGKKSARKTRKK